MRARDASLAASASGLAALALLPKCPLCFAALFVWAGASGTFAYDAAPFVKPCAALAAFAVVGALLVARRRRRCCATSSRTAPSGR